MKNNLVFLFICIDAVYSNHVNLTVIKEEYDNLIWNKRLSSHVIRRVLDTNLQECIKECLKTSRCLSINYAKKYPLCELNYETEDAHAEQFKTEVGFVFGNMMYFSMDLMGEECSGLACPLNSKCKETEQKAFCEISDCGIPELLRGAVVTGINQGIGIGDHRHYSCRNTEAISVCQEDGQWSFVNISCGLEDICYNEGNGYIYDSLTNMCLKPYNTSTTFDKARAVCLAEGADLVIVNTEDKQEYLYKYMCGLVLNSFWLGATDKEQEGVFKWVDNSTYGVQPGWAVYDNNAANGNEADCVKFACRDNMWKDIDCYMKRDFVCEKRG